MTEIEKKARCYCEKACNDEGLGCICHAEGCDVQKAYIEGFKEAQRLINESTVQVQHLQEEQQ